MAVTDGKVIANVGQDDRRGEEAGAERWRDEVMRALKRDGTKWMRGGDGSFSRFGREEEGEIGVVLFGREQRKQGVFKGL